MRDRPFRVTVVLSHPIQYLSPWFRHIASERAEIELSVIYAAVPAGDAQGVGFGVAFNWDVPLLEGYRSRVLGATPSRTPVSGDRFVTLDAPGLVQTLLETDPDAVLVPGWHTSVYRQAAAACRAHRIPLIYRGDTSLLTAPRGWRLPLWRLHTRRRLHEYDAWLAVGSASRDYLAAFRVPEPLVFHSPHAVDNAFFARAADACRTAPARAALRAEYGLNPDAFVVLFSGKLVAHKQPLDAVRAVAALGTRAELLVVGSGPLQDECRRGAQARGVSAVFRGFVNQSEMPKAYAAADCLIVPSRSESWGLVVNEAMAAGIPAVVTDRVGCAADLVRPGETGEIVRVHDVTALAGALSRIAVLAAQGHPFADRCRARIARFAYGPATDGLAAACDRLRRRHTARAVNISGRPRVVACCGSMVIAGGLERMTFEVLRTLRARGASVHVIVNRWESAPIVGMAEAIEASWSTGYYWQALSRRLGRPSVVLRAMWEACRTSAGLFRDAGRFGATHVLLPDFTTALRNLPALWWLRRRGVGVIMRLGNAPTVDPLHRRIWRHLIDPVVDWYAPNSTFIAGELARHGIGAEKTSVIYNTPSTRRVASDEPVAADGAQVVYVGQVIPPKGLDVLLEAIALVASRGAAVRLEVVGRAEGWEAPGYSGYLAHVRARATERDLAGRVSFAGYQDDVLRRFASAAIHCCPSQPSQREGCAGVVLEAKAAGIPSVVTPTGSLPEMVRHRVDGWVARDESADALAEGLIYFLQDPDARRAAGAAARMSLQMFSRDRFERAWSGVFGLASWPAAIDGHDRVMGRRAS